MGCCRKHRPARAPAPAGQHCGGQEAREPRQRLRRQARLDTLCAPWGEAKVTSRWAEGPVPAGRRSGIRSA